MRSIASLLASTGLFTLSLTATAGQGMMNHGDHTSTEQSQNSSGQAWTCSMHPDVVTDAAGDCSKCGMKLVEAETLYTCPMHDDVRSSAEGSCPRCGMTLTAEDAKADEHGHH